MNFLYNSNTIIFIQITRACSFLYLERFGCWRVGIYSFQCSFNPYLFPPATQFFGTVVIILQKCADACVEESEKEKKCGKGSMWRDEKTCVPVKDCTCYSEGKVIKVRMCFSLFLRLGVSDKMSFYHLTGKLTIIRDYSALVKHNFNAICSIYIYYT